MPEPAMRPLIIQVVPRAYVSACTACGALVNDGDLHSEWHRRLASARNGDLRRMSPAEFEAKYPGACIRCGWSMAAHIEGPDVVHCPPSFPGTESPAVRSGDMAALHRRETYETEAKP